jgi:YD repeat-containing protein
VPDPAPTAPALPALGASLPGVALPADDPLEAAAVVADPVDVLPSQTSDVSLTVTTPEPVPSGYPVQTLVTEELTLLDGSRLAGPSFIADLALLRRGDGSLGLSIPVRASEGARRVALSVGYERFAVKKFPFEVRRGLIVGATGGTVTGASGWSATLPSGAVSGATSIALTALGVAELPASLPEDFDFVAAVRLTTGGVDFGLPVSLSYSTTVAPPSGRDLLVVAFEDRGGFLLARPVARAAYDAGSQTLCSSPIDRAAFPWPGVRGEGVYAFLVARDPLAFVAGRVLDVDASALRATLVSVGAGWTLQAVSENDGTFALAIRAAVSTLFAVRTETGNTGQVTVSPSAPGQEITGVELRLVDTAPWVAGVTPSAGSTILVGSRFTVTFSEAVDPLSITPSSFFLVATVEGQPVVVPAETLLDPSGLSATLVPAGALPSNTPVALGVARTVRDRNGYSLVDAITKAPADFAVAYTTEDLTPPDAKPYLVRITLPTGDPNPTIAIAGAPGAVCGGCHVVAYNDTTLATAATDALSDGSFTLTLAARATDSIRIEVEKANGTKQTLPPVPFTNDGGKTVLVGSKGGTWETPEGFRIGVPAAAFAGPVNVATERIPQATFQTVVAPPRDVVLVDAFRMDFATPATSGFDLSFAAPATSATDQFFVAQVVEVLGQKRLMVVDLLVRQNGRLVTDRSGSLQSLRRQGFVVLVDPKSSAVGGVVHVDAQLLSTQALGGAGSQINDPKSFFDGAYEKGMYALYNAAVQLATVAGGLGAGSTVVTSSAGDFLFDSLHALTRTYFRLLTPVGRPFDLTLVDRDSGLVLFEGSYEAPTGAGTVELVNPPSPDKVRPGLLGVGPARLHRFDAPVAETSSAVARGISARSVSSGDSVAVTVTVEKGVVSDGARLRLVDFSRSGLSDTVSTGEGSTLTLQSAQRGDALGLVLENMSAPLERSLLVRFDESMKPLGASWKSVVVVESDSGDCPAVGYDVIERPSDGPGVRELLVVPVMGTSAWLQSGCRYRLRVKKEVVDLAGNEMSNDVQAEFSLPGDDPISTRTAETFVRKLLYHGGLLLATGEEQAIRVYDARTPGAIGQTCNMQAPVTPPATPGDCPTGATTDHVPLPGVGRDLAVDRFGRLVVVGGGTSDGQGASPGLGFLRLYDFVPTCGSPTGDCGRRIVPRGTTVISAAVGSDNITWPPQGTPRKIALHEEVQERSWRVDADDNTALLPPDGRTTLELDLPMPECDGPPSGSSPLLLAIQKTGADGRQGFRQEYVITSTSVFPPSPRCHKQRFFSFTNGSTGETVHARTDANGAGLYSRDGAVGVSLRASSGDRIRMTANGASVAFVDVLGYGIAAIDLDAVYDADDVAGEPPSVRDPMLASKLLLAYTGSSPSSGGGGCRDGNSGGTPKTCDEPYQRCGEQLTCNLRAMIGNTSPAGYPPVYKHAINDLLALTGIAVMKTEEPGVAWGFGSLNGVGLLSFSIDLRTSAPAQGGLLFGRERTYATGPNQTATIRNGHMIGLVSALPLEIAGTTAPARANDIALAEGVIPPAKPGSCGPGWSGNAEPRDLAFVAAGINGVFVVDVTDPAWPVEIGRFETRGGALAVSVDAVRKLLYVSDAGEGIKVFSFEDPCGSTPGGNTAVDDPRLVAVYPPGEGSLGNTPVSVDPDTGIVYGSSTGNGGSVVNGLELTPLPLYAVADTDLDGRLEPVREVIPLGVENASKTAAIGENPLVPVPAEGHGTYIPDHFRLLAFLPGGVGESIEVEVSSTNAGGYDIPPSTPGFPRSGYLSASPSRPDSRPLILRRSSDDPSDRAFNRYQSEAVTVLADPRARLAYVRSTEEKGLPNEKGKDNPDSCRNCDVSTDVAGSLLSADGKRTELWSGDLIRARFTDEVRTRLSDLGSSGIDLDASSIVIESVRGDLTPGLRQAPRESSSIGATDAAGVDLASGAEHLSGVDFQLAGRGLDLAVSRSYTSQVLHDGLLGRSWDSPLFARLRFLPGGDVDYYDGAARRDTFRFDAGRRELVAPAGLFAQLANGKDGSWYLTHADKTIQRFDADGRLIELWDAVSRTAQAGGDGNRIRLLHDGAGRLTAVLDTLDRTVTFDYLTEADLGQPGVTSGSVGRLKKVTDHSGRTVEYRYDETGRLTKVLLPELKTVALGLGTQFVGESDRPSITYSYPTTVGGDADGAPRRWLLESDNVVAVLNARLQETLRLDYEDKLGAMAEDVVTGQAIGGKPVTVLYERTPDDTVRATVTDRRGHDWVVEHSKAGHLAFLRLPQNQGTDANTTPSVPLPVGPLALGPIETRRNYGSGRDGLPNSIEWPGKEVESFGYQEGVGAVGRRAAANIVEATLVESAPEGTPPGEVLRLTTKATYETATNAVSTLTLPGDLTTRIDYVAGKGLPEHFTPPSTFGRDPGPDGQPSPVPTKIDYRYDNQARNGQLQSATDATNMTWALDYFDKGQDGYGFVKELFTTAEPSIRIEVMERDTRGNVLKVKNARGVVSERIVDEYDRVVVERQAVAAPVNDGGPRPWVTLQRAYDKDGNLEQESTTDGVTGSKKTVHFEWDALGRPLSRTENPGTAVAKTNRYEYDSAGNAIITTDPEGARTAVAYDARNLPIAVTRYPAPGRGETPTSTTTYLRDARGNVLEEFDGVNTRTQFAYDGLGRRVRIVSPRDAVTRVFYDAASRPSVVTTVDSDGKLLQKVETTYTPAGDVYEKKVTVLDVEGHEKGIASTRRGYDGGRRPVSLVDPLGRLTTWEYFDAARNVKMTDASGNVVTTHMDENGNPLEVVAEEKRPHSPTTDSAVSSNPRTRSKSGRSSTTTSATDRPGRSRTRTGSGSRRSRATTAGTSSRA